MANPDEHVVPERGYGMGYQDSVNIETRAMFGMDPEEFYRRQVGLVLDEIPQSLTGENGEIVPRKLPLDYKFPDGETLEVKVKKSGMR